MDEISLSNFRCFRDVQTVRLAPLTLLVGENSTGKTSFMALIRALWNIAYQGRVPDFKEDPYDLGSFDEIAHHRGARGGRAEEFFVGLKAPRLVRGPGRPGVLRESALVDFEVTFRKRGTAPFPSNVSISQEKTWVEHHYDKQTVRQRFGTQRGSWETTLPSVYARSRADRSRTIVPFDFAYRFHRDPESEDEGALIHLSGQNNPNKDDFNAIRRLCSAFPRFAARNYWVYASAPVRSVPRRTYDPAPAESDPEGAYVPMYLANIFYEDRAKWQALKVQLEKFGKQAGLFDEISIRSLGRRDSEPFQLQVRKFAGKLKGPRRNMIDVGYGVSQALPVITELMRDDRAPLLLLQQPEVHLHPSAQAALGTLFCEAVGPNRQLVVETHSDHLLDRVRMDIRDGATKMTPDDVSILFFERNALNVHIHSLRLDEHGNVLDAPDTYRRFFLEETVRSLGG